MICRLKEGRRAGMLRSWWQCGHSRCVPSRRKEARERKKRKVWIMLRDEVALVSSLETEIPAQ